MIDSGLILGLPVLPVQYFCNYNFGFNFSRQEQSLLKTGCQSLLVPGFTQHVLTVSWEWYCSNWSSMRLHLHDHFHFSQVKYPDGPITVSSCTVWWVNDSLISRLRLWMDSGYSLSFICDWLGGKGCGNWTKWHTIAGLERQNWRGYYYYYAYTVIPCCKGKSRLRKRKDMFVVFDFVVNHAKSSFK